MRPCHLIYSADATAVAVVCVVGTCTAACAVTCTAAAENKYKNYNPEASAVVV